MTRDPGSHSLWRHRDFMLLWSGQTVSEIGSAVSVVALPLLAVTVLHAGALQTGMLKAASSVAFLLLALPAGALVDRWAKRRLMAWCDAGRCLVLGLVPLLWWWGRLQMWELYLVAISAGVLTVFFDVAYQSLLPALLRKDQLVDGNGKLGSTQYFAYVAGTGLSGGLAALLGVARAVAFDALSFLVSVASLLLLRTDGRTAQVTRPRSGAASGRRMRDEITEGLGFVFRHPVLRRIVCCTASSNLGMSIAGAVDMIYVVRTLHVPAAYIGLVLSAAAVGGILGGAMAGRVARRVGSARIIWASFVCLGWTGLLIPLATPGWGVGFYVLGWTFFSVTATFYNTGQLSFRQAVCPPELLGRMNASIRWVIWGINPLGALLGGALGAWLGVRPALWIAMACVWSSGLWVFFSPLRGMRNIPAAGPPEQPVTALPLEGT